MTEQRIGNTSRRNGTGAGEPNRGGRVNQVDELTGEVAALRERLSRLSEASLHINESLDFETVLQEVMHSARALTGARYGMMLLFDDRGWIVDYVSSGGTPEQARRFFEMPDGMTFQKYLCDFERPLRLRDFQSHTRAQGLPVFRPPFPISAVMPYLSAPIRYSGERLGVIYLADKIEEPTLESRIDLMVPEAGTDDGLAFSADDEESLVMFASQAALVISNARTYRDEQRARAYLETLVNTAPVGVLVFDAETTALTSANREAQRIVSDLLLSEGSVQELLDTATYRSADGQQIPNKALPLARALNSNEAVRAEEIIIEAPNGRSVTTVVNATPIRTDAGEMDSVIMTVQDMTPLEELERLRAEFLGIVSHELRTPLTSIKGSATTLLEAQSSLDPAEIIQYHRIINEQADYMRDLIADLIDIVRIETGTLSVNLAALDVPRLVDEARNTFLSAGGRDNIRINCAPDLPPAMADRRRIVQVINNLLSNAERNSHETSVIRVDITREGVHVAVSITDSGKGVPAERLAHLFRKFSHPEGSAQGRDLGLGLAICKGIVEAHGGRIWAESDGPGLGSRFTFTIPASEQHPIRPTARHTPVSANTRRENTGVLAVDDDPRTLKLVRDALTTAGYKPVVTGDPQQAIPLIEETNPGVVLLDLMLPGTDGIELMRDILSVYDVPIIFLSAYDQDELIARAFKMGAVDYIVKPFSPTELAARVKAALRKRAAPSDTYTSGDLTIDYPQHAVTIAGHPVDLTPTEYRLLVELSTNAGIALTHDQLLKRIWGTKRTGDARPLRTAIKNLRRKLNDQANNPKYIITMPHIGYRMPKTTTAAQT